MVKRRTKKKTGLILLCVWLVIIILFCTVPLLAFDSRLRSTEYTVSSPSVPEGLDGIRILLIADLHCERFGEDQSELIAAALKTSPDLAVLCGDILDSGHNDLEPVAELLSGLDGIETFAVFGNHENGLTREDREALTLLYEEHGVTLLSDESVGLSFNGAELWVSGMKDPAFWGMGDTEFVRENPPDVAPKEGAFNVLLCHRANLFPATSELGFDLVLSGHLHGGQVRIPLVGGLVSPNMELFPDYTSGLYSENGSFMAVSRGLGNSVDLPRIFNPPELVTVILRSTSSSR